MTTDHEILSASTLGKAHNSDKLGDWRVARIVEYMHDHPGATLAQAEKGMYTPAEGHRYGAMKSGTVMHSVLEAWLKHEAPPDSVPNGDDKPLDGFNLPQMAYLWPMGRQLRGWLDANPTTAVMQERFVYNLHTLIGGRLDLIADVTVDGVTRRLLIDLKTKLDDTKTNKYGTYPTAPWAPTVSLQLAAYQYATHVATWEPRLSDNDDDDDLPGRRYLVSDNEHAQAELMVPVDGAAVLFLTPARCCLYPFAITPDTYRAATYAAESGRHQNVTGRKTRRSPIAVYRGPA